MADLRLRISIVEKNERGQEVELVRKTIQFNPQVRQPTQLERSGKRIVNFTLLVYFVRSRESK